jgi:hypothetical protein
MTIWLIRGRAEALASSPTVTKSELYLGLRADLEWLLGFLGAVIGLAVLAGAELRHVLSFDKKADFGAEGTVLYGLVLSLLVALIYLPTFATLQRTGIRIRDSVEGLPEPGDPMLEARLAKRKSARRAAQAPDFGERQLPRERRDPLAAPRQPRQFVDFGRSASAFSAAAVAGKVPILPGEQRVSVTASVEWAFS